jgi:hypothetical protein
MREVISLTTPSSWPARIEYADRKFHVEVMRGGMNRLLLRSNIGKTWDTRIEVLFMNVKYMSLGTAMDGLVVEDLGVLEEHWDAVPWALPPSPGLHHFEIRSGSGTGRVVAGAVAVDISDDGPSEPSRFFMMS